MYITRLKIRDFEGIEALDLEPSRLTILRGQNGAGKTSVLEAVRAAISNRPERSRLVRDGNGHSSLVLFELSDGTTGERRVTDEGRTAGSVELKRGDVPLKSPQGILDKLQGGFGLNPVSFLNLNEGEQREAILRVTKVDLPIEEAIRLSAGERRAGVSYDAHPLQVLKQIKESLYYYRRDVNRDALKLRNAAEKMREAVAGRDIDTELLRNFDLEKAIAKLTRAQDAEKAINQTERRIGQIEGEMQRLRAELTTLQAKHAELVQQRVNPAPIRADIEAFKRDQDAWRTLQQANDKDSEAVDLEERSEHLTTLIEEVRGKPAELLQSADLPVEGMGIDSKGNITINALPISELSTGESLMLATDIAIATLPADGLRIVLVDGLEQLDADNRDKMLDKLLAVNVQVLAAEVGEGELTVITDYGTQTPASILAPAEEADEFDDDKIPF
ncbi:MAG: hypothetical protein DRI81_07495 [Chloroflexi bacterium]|nr:MAG: hypothetical protein DRI81_07495 [Chloroflexota bacterium]